MLLLFSIAFHRFPRYTFDDFLVVFFLLSLMVVVKGLERSGVVTLFAAKLSKWGGWATILATAILSAFVTNDIALIVMITITLSMDIDKKDKELLVILETIAANGFSSLTPFGNPQNIFIYIHYKLSPLDIPLAVWSLPVFVLVVSMVLSKGIKAKENDAFSLKKRGFVHLAAFATVLLCVLKILPFYVAGIVLIGYIFFDAKSFKVDYPLLLAFVFFFGLTDLIAKTVNISLEGWRLFISSSIFSQFISNVPAALSFADFTGDWKALLWGVNVGGFGFILASMANLIAFRMYRFSLKRFHFYSFVMFFAGVVVYLIFGR